MKYLIYISIFLIVFAPVFFSFRYLRKLKKDMAFKLLTQDLMSKQKYIGREMFFSSAGIRELIKCAENPQNLSPYATAIRNAFIDPTASIQDFEDLCNRFPNHNLYKTELAKLYLINGRLEQAENIIEKIEDKKSDNYIKAVKDYIQAFRATSDGDMLSASQKASSSLRHFEKDKAFFEAAMVYMLIGTIYRVSATYDVAQCMFEAAKDIFIKMKLEIPQAISLANLGMLTAAQKRYEEAEEYFSKALDINIKLQNLCGQAEVLNQTALMETTKKNYAKAFDLAKQAQNIHNQIKNFAGEALSWDIISYIKSGEQKYTEVIETTTKAVNLYNRTNNTSAKHEMLFMQASAYFELEQHLEAEKILRNIIAQADEHSSCFHSANAYNLLGLIFLRKNDLAKAKTFFMQAVQREEKNDRLSGAAVDYANLALIEQKCGNHEQAEKTLKLALEYAQSSDDNNLIEQIKSQMNKLNCTQD